MATPKTRIVFFGTDEFSVASLEALITHGYDVIAVVTKPDAPAGRGRSIVEHPVKAVASENHLVVLQPARSSDIEPVVADLKPQLAVVVSYGKILPQATLDLFPQGVLNLHPSLLPRYRGATPIEAAIAHGDTQTGVSLMQLDDGMDTGPIYAQEKIRLTGSETRLSLEHDLAKVGAELLVRHLPGILNASVTAKPQNDDAASTVSPLRKDDGIINWREPAEVIERRIRAYLGWPGSRTTIGGSQIIISAASVVGGSGRKVGKFYRTEAGDLAVATRQGDLVIDKLKPAGRNEMTGRAWLAGHPLT